MLNNQWECFTSSSPLFVTLNWADALCWCCSNVDDSLKMQRYVETLMFCWRWMLNDEEADARLLCRVRQCCTTLGHRTGSCGHHQSWSSVYRLVTRPGTRNIVTITATQHSVLSRRWEHDPDTCILYYSLTCSVAQIITLWWMKCQRFSDEIQTVKSKPSRAGSCIW